MHHPAGNYLTISDSTALMCLSHSILGGILYHPWMLLALYQPAQEYTICCAKAYQSSVVSAPDMLRRMMQYLAHLHPVSESIVYTNGTHHMTIICLHGGSLLQPVAGRLTRVHK